MATELQRRVTGNAEIEGAVAVRAQGVSRAFGERRVLDDLSLTVRTGEFVAMIGRSGSGKSTFLRGLAGLDGDIEGELHVPPRRAVVFQDPRLLPFQRVLANVSVGLRGPDRARLARDSLREVGLEERANAWPRTLSGGEAQRVALARALVREPKLLLLDEPFAALDALTKIQMHALLRDLCARHQPAVLLVTHDADEAILLADRVVLLENGRIAIDERITLGSPRLRSDPEFLAVRSRLLGALGVSEASETGQIALTVKQSL
jgi:sulfonate transport system ATP-binding protein